MTDCEIQFDDEGLSRYQCCIYNKENRWYIEDGNGGKQSTNGTWLFLEQYFPLKNETIFKAGQTLFISKLIN